jgi:hypothetical protein
VLALDEEKARIDAAQYFDPFAAPLIESDAAWAIGKAKDALSGVKALLAATPPGPFG